MQSDFNAYRLRSIERMAKAGIVIPPHLPPIEGHLWRSEEEVVNRMLCLTAVAAVAHGLPSQAAIVWLNQEGLDKFSTPEESRFLHEGVGDSAAFMEEVEAIFALAWALNLYADMDLWTDVDDDLANKMPDLKSKEQSNTIRKMSSLREQDDVLAVADLAYCLHWAVTDALVNGRPVPTGLRPDILEGRRRAFEWLIGQEEWSEVSLDT